MKMPMQLKKKIYYFLNLKPFDTAIILHDSVFINTFVANLGSMKGETWNMEDLKDLAPSNFLRTALSLMAYQASNNAVYNEWIQSMKLQLDRIECLEQIPFLPIHFFKTDAISLAKLCNEIKAGL